MIDLKVRAAGDLHVDYHHTTEDTAIVIGQAVKKALWGFFRHHPFRLRPDPHGRGLTRVAIDISNRPYLIWKVEIPKPKLGEMDTDCSRNGSRPSPRMPGCACISKIFMRQQFNHIVETCFKGRRHGLCGKP